MSLSEQEKTVLHHFLARVLEADEPVAMLGSLRRVAELKAWDAVRGVISDQAAAVRWQEFGNALDLAREEFTIRCRARGESPDA